VPRNPGSRGPETRAACRANLRRIKGGFQFLHLGPNSAYASFGIGSQVGSLASDQRRDRVAVVTPKLISRVAEKGEIKPILSSASKNKRSLSQQFSSGFALVRPCYLQGKGAT
jgi:hypothetical protein